MQDILDHCVFGDPSYLPPANKAWGKVIFSQACVKNSVHRWEGSGPRGACSRGGVSRPTPKGEVEEDLVQGHTQGGS